MVVAFDEQNDSPQIEIRLNDASARRHGKIAWSDIPDFLNEHIAPTFLAGSSTGPSVTTAFPGWPWLRVQSCSITPFSGSPRIIGPDENPEFSTLVQYDHADVVVNYATLSNEFPLQNQPYNPSPGEPTLLLEHSWTPGGEFMVLEMGDGYWKWVLDDGVVNGKKEVGKFVPTIEHRVHWPRVLNPPFSVIRDRIGKVNDAPMEFVTGKILRECLLFAGCEMSRSVMSDGTRAWDVTYHFSERYVKAYDVASIRTLDFGISVPTSTDGYVTPVSGTMFVYFQPAYGGWNHMWRNDLDETAVPTSGWYRMSHSTGTAPNLVYTDAIYEWGSFEELFKSEPQSSTYP